ncbi:LysM peptidoglycan-binding domain-containing protein [Antarcticirhabdus aurantiaca]|uniref:DUF5818 domain-containing protein n=1 Tax=Antarcticirhabdus aurantiaca TaxID=2606717 RepID=A0ACD4NTK1_9HYPH|nr:LysM peptidoglycan-binding domain-containing protein [Antarcticirhabdus aurantiaca]WAJ30099.1 DUF5818 domain-containing protein [Jeongeuplla avenae]
MRYTSIRLVAAAAAVLSVLPAGFPPAAQAQAYCSAQVRVGPGDTLYAIARRCGVPPEVILDANPRVDFDRLQVGQSVSVPRPIGGGGGGGFTPAPPPPREPPPPPPPRRSDRANLSIDRGPIEPGGTALIRLSGFGQRETVTVTAGPARGRQLTQYQGRVPPGRATIVEIDIPSRARPGERWIVEAQGDRGSYASSEFRVDEPDIGGEEITVSGVLTNEGAECPTLRARNGLFSLSGRLGRFHPGDIVTVTGVLTDYSVCQQGQTIEVDEIRPAR